MDVAVVIPGLLYGADSYSELCVALTEQGYPAVVVPMQWWHWLPCLGGRSMRPVLERIDYAVDHVLAYGAESPVPDPSYTALDLLGDSWANPGGVLEVGGSGDPAEYPRVDPLGADFASEARRTRPPPAGEGRRVALVGHSAGGWIARIFLGPRAYGGRAYRGAERVHSLVTLGSPHAPAPGVAFRALEWLAQGDGAAGGGAAADGAAPGASAGAAGAGARGATADDVRALAVGAVGLLAGDSSDFTRNAYVFCGADKSDPSVDGDGVTPLFSAHAFAGAETLTLEGVTHASEYPAWGPTADLARRRAEGQPWYGSRGMLRPWLEWLQGKRRDS